MQYKKETFKQKLLAECKKEFLTYGYALSSLNRIAKNSDITAGNIYRYYAGKAEILEEIVAPAYNEVPSIIEHLTAIFPSMTYDETCETLCKTLVNIYKVYGDSLLILANKCADTVYQDFSTKLIHAVKKVLLKKLFKSPSKDDEIFVIICSKSLVTSVFDVYELGYGEREMGAIINRILNYHFYKINERI